MSRRGSNGRKGRKEEEGHLPRLRKLPLALGFAQRPIEISDDLLTRQPSGAREQSRAWSVISAFQKAPLEFALRGENCVHRWP